MSIENKSVDQYSNGTEFWNDTVQNHSINDAFGICSNYLDTQLKTELSNDVKQFCRELFVAMYEAEMDKINPNKLIYPYDFKIADTRGEASYYHKNQNRNRECANTIDRAISNSSYESNYYNPELAAMLAISTHGFERVNAALAHQIQGHENDGRYSTSNKKWAKDFKLSEKAFRFMNSHATLLDSFIAYTRKLYTDLGADRSALVGNKEQGELVHGYEIIHSIMIDKNQGYAIGNNLNAVSHYVCWQFYIRDGKRDYNWGIYGEEQDAIDAFNARCFVAFN